NKLGLSLPCDGPLDCRFVFVKPGWAALDAMPQPSRVLRRSSSMANIRLADFDCAYARVALYRCSHCRSAKLMPPMLIRMSIGRPSALSSPPSALTLASDDRSRLLIVSFAFGTVARICSIADSPLAWLRMAMITSAPAADSRVANPRPRPEFEPVTTASLPDRSGTVTASSLRAMAISLYRWDDGTITNQWSDNKSPLV